MWETWGGWYFRMHGAECEFPGIGIPDVRYGSVPFRKFGTIGVSVTGYEHHHGSPVREGVRKGGNRGKIFPLSQGSGASQQDVVGTRRYAMVPEGARSLIIISGTFIHQEPKT